jgi:hypothetical protein
MDPAILIPLVLASMVCSFILGFWIGVQAVASSIKDGQLDEQISALKARGKSRLKGIGK